MSSPIRLLLIEDDADDAALTLAVLEQGGLSLAPRRVESSLQLREALAGGGWDIVLSDYSLPGFDGLRALAMVRAVDADVPFVMISGAVGEEFIVDAMRAGAQDFIAKDRLVRLVPVVRRELGETENRRARRRAEQALRELTLTLEQRVAERTALAEKRADQLQRLALELSRAEDRQRRQIAMLLHDDLQQYLAAIRFHLQILLPKDVADEKLREQVAHLEQLIGVSIQKCHTLSHELSPPVLYQNGFLPALAWLAKDMEAKHGLKVKFKKGGEADSVSAPLGSFLFRAVKELLFNVVKHSQTDSVLVTAKNEKKWICISVKDRGKGCDAAAIQSKAGSTSGFGLFTIKERLEFLGGRLEIKSAPGKGCTVKLHAPREGLQKSQAPDAGTDAYRTFFDLESTAARTPPPAGRTRILLADDHAVMRQGLAFLLKDENSLEVVGQAADGREAVRLAEELNPDLILMDVSMPVKDGIEATSEIKRIKPRIRIIGLSMHDDPVTQGRMMDAGASAYMYKGAPAERLIDAIRSVAEKFSMK